MRFPFLRLALVLAIGAFACGHALAQRQMETLNRGLVAVRKGSTQVYLSWRLFGNDPSNVAFNLYRSANGGLATKLNTNPITATTDYTDTPGTTNLTNNAYSYFVRPVIDGVEQANSETAALPANPPQKQFLTLPLRADTGPNGPYTVKFCWVGDLDGDGDYDYVVDRLSTLGAYEQFLEAYTNDGAFLWRMAMGPNSVYQYNIEPGSSAISIGHGDNVTVYDMDGDGMAEVLIRTSNGVVFGDGSVASGGASNDVQFLSVVNGMTGAELARATVPNPRLAEGPMNGHMGILYLDGKRPSVLLAAKNRAADESFHGTITAWDWRGGALTQRWSWEDSGAVHSPEGHQIRVADVDNDGKDELVDIGYVLDDDGTQLFNIPEVVHGDRFHLTDIDPDRPGLENFIIQQNNGSGLATALFDAGTGDMVRKWYAGGIVDVGRGIALDITSAHKGCEMFSTQPGIFNAKGQQIYTNNQWAPEGLWWDGDLGREFIDGAGSGALNPVINKFNPATGGTDRVWSLYSDWGDYSIEQAYGGRPAFWGDILGDWREELVFIQTDYTALRIYTTTNAASNRLYTLMHNPQYRCQATTKGYVQASYVDYYLGHGMSAEVSPPPMAATDLTWSGGAAWDVGTAASWKTNGGASSVFAQGNRVLFDISGSNAAPVVLSGILTPSAVSCFNPQDFVLDGAAGSLAGGMTFSKSGKGRVVLTGAHGYTGGTTIWDGALVVNGQLSASPVTVWGGIWGGAPAMGLTGGRLSGSGTVSQPVSVEYRGAIAPGMGMGSAAILALGSHLTAKDGAVLALDLSNDPSGVLTPNDKITVVGNLSLSGTVAIDIVGSLVPGTYTLLTYGGTLTGSVSNLALKVPEGVPYTVALGSGSLTLTVPITRAPTSLTWTGGNGGNAWDLAATVNWSRSGTPDKFVSGDTVTFDAAGLANPVVNLTTSLPVAGVTVSSASDYTFSGAGFISGAGGLTKAGAGTLTLQNNNTYTGPTIVTGGTLAVNSLGDGGSPSSIGAAGTAASNLVLNGGTLALAGEQTNTNRSMTLGSSGGIISMPVSKSLQISGVITGSGSLTKSGAGTLILASSNTFSGGTFISEGNVFLASDSANVSGLGSGLITLNGGTLSMSDNTDLYSWDTSTWSIHVPTGSAGRLNSDGRCNLTGALTGGGEFTFYTNYYRTEVLGNWSAFTGRIFIIADADGGDFRFQSSAGYPLAALDLGSGVSAYYNKTMSGNLTIPIGNLSGATTAWLGGGLTAGRTLTYQIGGRNEDGVYSGALGDSAGPLALSKIGTGTLTLAGTCTHTGATTVSAGRLRVMGSTSGSTVTVQSGGTLGGTGTITGNVSIQSGGGLEFNGAPLAMTGDLTFAGNAVVRPAAGLPLVAGNHTLLTYTGTLAGSPNLTWEMPPGLPFAATFDTSVPNIIMMTLVELPRVPGPVIWSGADSYDWDGVTDNWLVDVQAVSYLNGDTVTFTDAGNAASPINLTTAFTPAAVVVDSTKNHTFSGVGSMSGSATLSKSGSGTLTLTSSNNYSGGTTISGGKLVLGSNVSFSAGGIGTGGIIFEGGVLAHAFSTGNTVVYGNAMSVAAGMTGTVLTSNRFRLNGAVTGAGTLNMAISTTVSRADFQNNFTGFSGILNLTGSGGIRVGINSLGTNQPLFNATGWAEATLSVDGVTVTPTITSAKTIPIGALTSTGSAGTLAGGTGGTATYSIGAKNLDTTYAGKITGNAALTKTGDGILILSGTNTYTGITTVSSGKLTVTGSLAATTTTTIAAISALGGNGNIAGAVTCHGTLAPGDPAGILTLGAGLTLSSTSMLDCELGTSSDQVAVTGNLTLDGTVNVSAAPGFAAGAYTLITYTGSLTNNTLNIGSVPPGFIATVNTATSGQVRLLVSAVNSAPQIIGGPAATPASVTGTSTALAVTATDNGGEVNLTYTWSAAGPGAVSFSPDGNNGAKNTTATFSAPGSYTISVTVTDGPGLTAGASIPVTVVAVPTTLTVAPMGASLSVGASQAYSATVFDQFGGVMTGQSVIWSGTGGGSISPFGLFTATMAGGPFEIWATSGTVTNTASVTVMPAAATITLGNLTQTYDGSEKSVTVTTDPIDRAHAVTYNNAPTKPTAVGTYAVVATITDPNYQGTTSGFLVIEPGGISWISWQNLYFSEAEQTAGLAAETADPDFDSLANLGEYALGTHPWQFTAPLVPTRDATGLSLTFTRPAALPDVSYGADSTVDFGTWLPVPLEVLNPDSDPETVRARDPLTTGDLSKRFLRLRFEK